MRNPPSDELGYLGKQIFLAIEASAHPDQIFHCEIQDKDLSGKELVGDKQNNLRFLTFDSLPGSIHIMAIGLNDEAIFVELSPYDQEEVDQLLQDDGAPVGFRVSEKGIFQGKTKLASVTYGSKEVAEEHGDRVLWTIQRSLSQEQLHSAIRILDFLDIDVAYRQDEYVDYAQAPSAHGSRGPKLEMRLALKMDIIQVQVPVLALHQNQELGIHPDQLQIMQLRQLQCFEFWLERDPEGALNAFVERDPSPEGQKQLTRFIQFALARKVKNAAASTGTEIPWKFARKIVRRISSRPASAP